MHNSIRSQRPPSRQDLGSDLVLLPRGQVRPGLFGEVQTADPVLVPTRQEGHGAGAGQVPHHHGVAKRVEGPLLAARASGSRQSAQHPAGKSHAHLAPHHPHPVQALGRVRAGARVAIAPALDGPGHAAPLGGGVLSGPGGMDKVHGATRRHRELCSGGGI